MKLFLGVVLSILLASCQRPYINKYFQNSSHEDMGYRSIYFVDTLKILDPVELYSRKTLSNYVMSQAKFDQIKKRLERGNHIFLNEDDEIFLLGCVRSPFRLFDSNIHFTNFPNPCENDESSLVKTKSYKKVGYKSSDVEFYLFLWKLKDLASCTGLNKNSKMGPIKNYSLDWNESHFVKVVYPNCK